MGIDKFYMIGSDDDDIQLLEWGTGARSSIMGTVRTPYISFYVSPEPFITKTFDNFDVVSNKRLATADLQVYKESSTQQALGMDIGISRLLEDNFRIKVVRDASNARMRGLYGDMKVYWPTTDQEANLISVISKYRPSKRML